MKKSALLLAFFVSAASHAQTIPSLSNTTYKGQSDPQGNQWGEITVSLRSPVLAALQGAPFSGKEERRLEQLLADGTRITQPSAPPVSVARDAQGRTRVERSIGATLSIPGRAPRIPLMMVEINDVVDGYLFILDPAKKIAYRIKYAPVEPRTVKTTPVPTLTVPPRDPKSPEMKLEPLGAKVIQGQNAEGRRTTLVYPAGVPGNDGPMTEVQEVWIVPSLQVTVLSTSKSPRANMTSEITNLSTASPSPALFRPPPGYEVRDQPSTFTVEFGNRPAGGATAGTPR